MTYYLSNRKIILPRVVTQFLVSQSSRLKSYQTRSSDQLDSDRRFISRAVRAARMATFLTLFQAFYYWHWFAYRLSQRIVFKPKLSRFLVCRRIKEVAVWCAGWRRGDISTVRRVSPRQSLRICKICGNFPRIWVLYVLVCYNASFKLVCPCLFLVPTLPVITELGWGAWTTHRAW